MNEKDYKAIAEIIAIKGNSESQTTINYRKFLTLKLADYFKKEYLGHSFSKEDGSIFIDEFDKKQFLKDCGVERDAGEKAIKQQGIRKLPDDMTGHIVFWDECLDNDCYYMRVSGGFGAKKNLMGRMLLGEFYKSLEDVKNNIIATTGNTKCYPDGYIPELKVEK